MLAVGVGGGGLDIFSLAFHLLFFSLSRRRRNMLKYFLKEPLT